MVRARWGVPAVLILVAVLPVLRAAVQGIAAGWWPINDEALSGLAAHDVVSGHPPVMGPRTTTRSESGIETHHPGPLLYYLWALPQAAAGGRPWGLILGATLLTVVIVAVGVLAAHRLTGPIGASTTAAAFLGLQWAIGPDAGARAFNPNPAAFGTVTLLVLTAALLADRLAYLPAFLLVTSLVIQSHIGYLAFTAPLLLGLAVTGLLRWWRRRRAIWPLPGWRPPTSRRHSRAIWWGIALTVVAWLPPLVELFRFSPNNLVQVLAYVRTDRGSTLDTLTAARFGLGIFGPVPGGFVEPGGNGFGASAHMVRHPRSAAGVFAGTVILLLLVTVALGRRPWSWLGRRSGRALTVWAPRRIETFAARAALLGVAGTGVVVVSLPVSSAETPWNYLQVWAVVVSVWAVLGAFVLRLLLVVLERSGRLRIVPAVAAVPVLALVAALSSPVPTRWNEGEGFKEAVPQLTAHLEDIERDAQQHPLHVTIDAIDLGGAYEAAPAIAYGLKERYHYHLGAVWDGAEDTDFRKTVTSPPDTAWITIRSGILHQGAEGVNPRAVVGAYVPDGNGAQYTMFVRGPDEGTPPGDQATTEEPDHEQ